MKLLGILRGDSASNSTESSGYYERVPIRVGEFALVENSEGEIVFETTSRKFCDDGPKIVLRISNSQSGWSVSCSQGSYNWNLTPSVDLTYERVARRRAMWHAAQYMSGQDLSHVKRYTIMHQVNNEETADVFEDDAFFKNGDAVTNDPFGEFL